MPMENGGNSGYDLWNLIFFCKKHSHRAWDMTSWCLLVADWKARHIVGHSSLLILVRDTMLSGVFFSY